MQYGQNAGTGLNITFNGTGLDVIALKGPTYGVVRTTLDGVETTITEYASSYQGQRVVYARRGLTNGSHTLRFEWTGQAAGGGTDIGIDAVDVVGALTQAPFRGLEGHGEGPRETLS